MTTQPDSFIAAVFSSPPTECRDKTRAAYEALILTLYKGSPERKLIETMRDLYSEEVSRHPDPEEIDGSCDLLDLHASEVSRLYRDMAQSRREGPDRRDD